MSKININNYEAYLLDYLEGNLNESDFNELKNFAVLHPELNIDLEKNELPYFDHEDLRIDFKSDLIKSEDNLADERVIAFVEGKLSEKEKEKFEKELESDKTLAHDLELYSKSFLQADKNIVFETKNLLIKNEDELLLNNSSLLYVEGLLVGNEKNAFENEMKGNSVLKSEVEIFRKTKLPINLEVLHPNKESLKKESKVIVLFNVRTVVAIAAALLLIVGLVVVFNNINSNFEIKNEILTKNNDLQKNESKKVLNSDSIIRKPFENKFVPQKINLANKNSTKNVATKIIKDVLKVDEENQENKSIVKDEKQQKEIINTPIIGNDTIIVSNKVKENVKTLPNNSNLNNHITLLAYEEDSEEIVIEENQKKSGFWKRAARLAKKANGLGMKAINGEEKSGDKFMLSFNAFSIEKK